MCSSEIAPFVSECRVGSDSWRAAVHGVWHRLALRKTTSSKFRAKDARQNFNSLVKRASSLLVVQRMRRRDCERLPLKPSPKLSAHGPAFRRSAQITKPSLRSSSALEPCAPLGTGRRVLTARKAMVDSSRVGRWQAMEVKMTAIPRRTLLRSIGAGGAGLVLAKWLGAGHEPAQQPRTARNVPPFTGPGANSLWNSVGPVVNEPQKAPLILLTDRPVQLETPRHYFASTFTPNEAFYVRWHLDGIPNAVDLKEWRLRVEGSVQKPPQL